MEWINVNEKVPPAWLVVWIYWRDREVLLGCRTDDDSEPMDNWYSFEDQKAKWTRWWMPIDSSSFHEPRAPKE